MSEHFDPESAFTRLSALRSGFTRHDLEGPHLERPFHGLRAVRRPLADEGDEPSPAELQRNSIRRAAERFAVYMSEHEFFSHTTAAVIWGIPLPLLHDATTHVSVLAPCRAPRGRGVTGHQLAPRSPLVVRHPEYGFLLTSPAATWALLGRTLHHYDLVAAADGAVHVERVAGPHGRVKKAALASLTDLEAAVPHKRRGVVALREALPRVRTGVASRPESWARLTIVDTGLPEPQTDLDVYDAAGEFIGCVDLAYPSLKIAIEYEGDHHRIDRTQWNRDIQKHELLLRSGWRVIRVTARMLFAEPDQLVSAVRAALRDRR